MNIKLIIISILLILSAVIALINTAETTLNFLFFTVQAPLIVMIIVIFILGLVTGISIISFYSRKKRLEGRDDERLKSNADLTNPDD